MCPWHHKLQAFSVKPEPGNTQMLGHRPIERALAVGGVADDRMRNVLQVAPDLMPAPGERPELELGIADFRIRSVCHRQGAPVQYPKKRLCRQALRPRVGSIVFHAGERMVNLPVTGRPAPHDRAIGFSDPFAAFETLAQRACRARVERKGKDATGGFIEPVQRKHRLPEQLAKRLQDHTCFPAVKCGCMDEPARGFADHGEPIVAVQQRKGRGIHQR